MTQPQYYIMIVTGEQIEATNNRLEDEIHALIGNLKPRLIDQCGRLSEIQIRSQSISEYSQSVPGTPTPADIKKAIHILVKQALNKIQTSAVATSPEEVGGIVSIHIIYPSQLADAYPNESASAPTQDLTRYEIYRQIERIRDYIAANHRVIAPVFTERGTKSIVVGKVKAYQGSMGLTIIAQQADSNNEAFYPLAGAPTNENGIAIL